jgi:hypothetical protein
MIYKVSYVVMDGKHAGAILSTDDEPIPGEQVTFDGRIFEIVEVIELMPPIGDFCFMHVTCRYLGEKEAA